MSGNTVHAVKADQRAICLHKHRGNFAVVGEIMGLDCDIHKVLESPKTGKDDKGYGEGCAKGDNPKGQTFKGEGVHGRGLGVGGFGDGCAGNHYGSRNVDWLSAVQNHLNGL